MFVVSRF